MRLYIEKHISTHGSIAKEEEDARVQQELEEEAQRRRDQGLDAAASEDCEKMVLEVSDYRASVSEMEKHDKARGLEKLQKDSFDALEVRRNVIGQMAKNSEEQKNFIKKLAVEGEMALQDRRGWIDTLVGTEKIEEELRVIEFAAVIEAEADERALLDKWRDEERDLKLNFRQQPHIVCGAILEFEELLFAKNSVKVRLAAEAEARKAKAAADELAASDAKLNTLKSEKGQPRAARSLGDMIATKKPRRRGK